MERNYWIHRISHKAEVSYKLLERDYLSIGFSDFLKDSDVMSGTEFLKKMTDDTLTLHEKDEIFIEQNLKLWGALYRTRTNLQRFLRDFKAGDWVVVPSWGTFGVYELVGKPLAISELDIKDLTDWNHKAIEIRDGYLAYKDGGPIDIGFVYKVKKIASEMPRNGYAENSLLSRMKIRQTNADINDIKETVEEAVKRHEEKHPINIYAEAIDKISLQLKDIIDRLVDPTQFERLVKSYFERIGADEVTIPSKSDGKEYADGDVIARFDNLKLYIYVQVKHHIGETGEWGVEQISEYIKAENRKTEEIDEGYSRIAWVITSAEGFTTQAYSTAKDKNVRLISGQEFRRMLIDAGISEILKCY